MIDVVKTRLLWSVLHTFADKVKDSQDQLSFMADWLEESERALGCPSCWWKVKRFLRHWPVAYGEELWLWSICLHDYVNKEMGKPFFHPDLTLAPLKDRGIIQ